MKFTSFLLAFSLCFSLPLTISAEGSVSDQISEKCKYPKAPEIPNGGTASEEELVAAQGNMKAYMAEGDDFIACITEYEESLDESEGEEERKIIILYNNKVVDDMQAVADLFNSAVRAYKGKK